MYTVLYVCMPAGVEGFSEASFSGQSYLEYSADAVSIDL